MIDLAEQLEPLGIAPSPLGADGLGQLRHRADRRRRAKRVAVVGLSALLVVAIVAGVALARSAAPPRPPVTSGPLPTVPSVGAAALARGHWGTIPAAPIVTRYDAVELWTSRGVIVWGGASVGAPKRVLDDGAIYDPSRHQWGLLSASPLSARMGAAAVWTGPQVIFWGGTTLDGRPLDDGAAYDLRTGVWRRLPPSPLSTRVGSTLVWSGHDVVVVGGSKPFNTPSSAPDEATAEMIENARPGSSHEAASYDPRTDQWRMLPDLPVPPHHRLDSLTAVWADGKLLEWCSWDHTVITRVPNGATISGDGGGELYTYDPALNSWRRDELAKDGTAPAGINGAYVDGTTVVLPATQPFRLPFSKGGPVATDLHGWTYDTRTRRYTPIPLGRTDGAHASTAWTGGALVSLNPGTEVTGGAADLVVGDGEAWDPATNRWTDLPRLAPPLYLSLQLAPIWTGDELIDLTNRPPDHQTTTLGGVELTPG